MIFGRGILLMIGVKEVNSSLENLGLLINIFNKSVNTDFAKKKELIPYFKPAGSFGEILFFHLQAFKTRYFKLKFDLKVHEKLANFFYEISIFIKMEHG